jgi:hypothetical protein
MNKTDLIRFIDLYNLGGFVEMVKLVSDGDTLKTSFISDDKTLAGTVLTTEVKLEKGEYGVYDTAQLKKLLSVLEEDVTVTVNKADTKPISLSVSDKNTETVCMLADLSIIPPAPKVKEIKSFDVEIPLDATFVEKFIKAQNALSNVETFTLMMNKKTKLELVLGYSSINSNRIKLDVTPTAGKDVLKAPISFSSKYLREILVRNQNIQGVVFKVAEAGISLVSFKTKEFESTYYLIKKEVES